VILRGRFGVTGVTSAETIWVMAATGMVVGAGYAGTGIALSLLILTVVTYIAALKRQYIRPCSYANCVVRFTSNGGKTAVLLNEILDEYYVPARDRRVSSTENGEEELQLRYCRIHRHHREFLVRLAELSEVNATIRGRVESEVAERKAVIANLRSHAKRKVAWRHLINLARSINNEAMALAAPTH